MGTHIAEVGTTIWDLLVTQGMLRMDALYPLSIEAVVFYFLLFHLVMKTCRVFFQLGFSLMVSIVYDPPRHYHLMNCKWDPEIEIGELK